MKRERAIELAAQCWCDPRTAATEMDVVLAEVIADAIQQAASEGRKEGLREAAAKLDGMAELSSGWTKHLLPRAAHCIRALIDKPGDAK